MDLSFNISNNDYIFLFLWISFYLLMKRNNLTINEKLKIQFNDDNNIITEEIKKEFEKN